MDWGRRRPQHELPMVADQAHRTQSPRGALSRGPVPVCERADLRSDFQHQRLALQEMRADSYPPLAVEFYSANEYWVKAGSLMSTDPTGRYDLPDHPLTRVYLLSSKQHGGAGDPTSKGLCQQFLNPLDSAPVQRALWIDLDEWSTRGISPPDSQVPRLRDGTLVPPLPQSRAGFPSIPGVTYTGLKTTRYRFNYGPDFYKTFIPTINPPVITPPYEDNPANGPIYPSYVPKTDSDGNDIAGIRLPELTVPLATYPGWGLRSGVW